VTPNTQALAPCRCLSAPFLQHFYTPLPLHYAIFTSASVSSRHSLDQADDSDGHFQHLADSAVPADQLSGGRVLHLPGSKTMNWLYVLSGAIALLLLAYLLYALCKPEKF
jgi:K+-transporting ATPase KdpF subunit